MHTVKSTRKHSCAKISEEGGVVCGNYEMSLKRGHWEIMILNRLKLKKIILGNQEHAKEKGKRFQLFTDHN